MKIKQKLDRFLLRPYHTQTEITWLTFEIKKCIMLYKNKKNSVWELFKFHYET
jgi:hypothetical protein